MKQSYRTLVCILTTVMLVITPLSVLSHQALGVPSTNLSLTVKSVNLAGDKISGLWTTIRSGSTVLKTGYTPLTFTAHPNTQYKVTVANYRNYVFEHWLNG